MRIIAITRAEVPQEEEILDTVEPPACEFPSRRIRSSEPSHS